MRQPLDDYDDRNDDFELLGDERADEYRQPERRFPTMLVSLLAMAVFAGGLWFAYYEGTRHAGVGGGAPSGGVPLIRADRQPDKVRPAQPGGMKIPNQDASIYSEKPGGPAVERLLPPPEKPLPRPAPAPPPPRAPAAAAAPPPASPAAAPQQSEEKTPEAVPPPARPAVRPAVAAARLRPEQAARGRLQVRLGSLRSPAAARAEWQRLKRDNPDLLGRLRAVAVRTDLGAKGIYYRIEAGPLADAAAAERLCGELRRRKFGCILAR